MNIFWPASFVKFPWHYWTEFSQSWKDLRKTLRSHENLWSLRDLSSANIGIHSNSRNWLFWMFMMSKINPLMNKSVLFWKDVFSTVFSIFIKIAKMRFQSTNILYHCSTCIEYIYFYQNCTVLCWFHWM